MSGVDVTAVVPSWNTRALLDACLAALERSEGPALEVVVVDNASADGSAELVAERHPAARLVRHGKNEGFARACNAGIEVARGRYVLLLNSDTEVAPDAIARLVRFLEERPAYGAAAPRLVSPDGTTQRSLKRFPGLWTPLFFATPLERWFPRSPELRRYFLRDASQEEDMDVEQPPAACLLVRRSVLAEVGPLDEGLWLFFNDVDLSRRMQQAGWRTRYLASATVLHHEGASTSRFAPMLPEWHRNRLAYYRKHHGRLAGLWVKACVSLAFADWCAVQLLRRLRGRGAEPLGRMLGIYLRFLRE